MSISVEQGLKAEARRECVEIAAHNLWPVQISMICLEQEGGPGILACAECPFAQDEVQVEEEGVT